MNNNDIDIMKNNFRFLNNKIIKIIYKYFNLYKKTKYFIYIFVGNVDDKIKKILNKIENMELYNAFLNLTLKEHETMIDNYGSKWFDFFFNKHYVKKKIKEFFKSDQIKNQLKKTLTTNIFDKYFNEEKKKNIRAFVDQNIEKKSGGGEKNNNEIENDDELNEIEELENFKKMYEDYEINEIKIGNDIKKMDLTNIEYIDFDDTKDKENFDDELENVYKKKYVYSLKLYVDDSIKIIKKKIGVVIKMNKFYEEKFNNFIPSRIYLWSEYFKNDEIKKKMITHTWFFNNEKMKLNIEPLKFINEDYYYNTFINNSNLKFEDLENTIYGDLIKYIENDEIFMIDIYSYLNCLINIQEKDELNKIYFSNIKSHFIYINYLEYENVINFIGKKNKIGEINNTNNKYISLYNELLLDNEIMKGIDYFLNNKKYEIYFGSVNILHALLFCKLKYLINYDLSKKNNNYNLMSNDEFNLIYGGIIFDKIFNDFEIDEKYIFISYKNNNSEIFFKNFLIDANINNYYDDEETKLGIKNNINVSWINNKIFGLIFKIRKKIMIDNILIEKIFGIKLNINKKLEIKMQWKENENVKNKEQLLYEIIVNLLEKINKN